MLSRKGRTPGNRKGDITLLYLRSSCNQQMHSKSTVAGMRIKYCQKSNTLSLKRWLALCNSVCCCAISWKFKKLDMRWYEEFQQHEQCTCSEAALSAQCLRPDIDGRDWHCHAHAKDGACFFLEQPFELDSIGIVASSTWHVSLRQAYVYFLLKILYNNIYAHCKSCTYCTSYCTVNVGME